MFKSKKNIVLKSDNILKKMFKHIIKVIGDILYDFNVFCFNKFSRKNKTIKQTTKNKQRLIFYIIMMSIPVLQFCIFYICVNINSIILAFKEYDYFSGAYSFVGFDNFKQVFNDIATIPALSVSFRNSIILFSVVLLGGITLALLFSFYIYKKAPLNGTFKVVLYMTQIIPVIALVVLYKYFTENAIPAIWEQFFGKTIRGILYNNQTKMGTLLFYVVWVGFGPQVMMFLGAMNGINVSLVESASIDGCSPLREFWSITLPMIYQTFVTFVVIAVAGIFINQMHLFSFFGQEASFSVYTFGYYLYSKIASPSITIADYPSLAAMGIVLTMISIPLTYGTKKFLEKIGPSVY